MSTTSPTSLITFSNPEKAKSLLVTSSNRGACFFTNLTFFGHDQYFTIKKYSFFFFLSKNSILHPSIWPVHCPNALQHLLFQLQNQITVLSTHCNCIEFLLHSLEDDSIS